MKNKFLSVHICVFLLFSFYFSQPKKEYSLPQIINIGLQHNPQILATKQKVKAKKAFYESSKLFFNPEIEFEKGLGESYETQQEVDTGGISVQQPLENPIKRKYRISMSENDWQASRHFLDFIKLEIIYKIKDLYFNILLLKNQKEITAKNLESIQEIHELIQERARLGEVKQLEVIKLNVEILKTQNDAEKIKTEMSLAKDNLNKLMGKALPSDFSIQGKLEYQELEINQKSLLDKVFAVHPLVKKKKKEVALTQDKISFIKWQRLPDPKIKAFMENEIDGKNKGLGISMEIPLWNFKSKEIAEAQSLYLKEREELKALQMELSTEIKSKFNQLKLSEQKIKLFRTGLLAQAEESLQIARISYEQGEISLIDYLDSQRTYNGVMKDYYLALYEWNTNTASLEKSLGIEIK
ncbi:MAG: TolC family protein [Candidatus Aminicenantes bacterium]